jgi:hypothetical protein
MNSRSGRASDVARGSGFLPSPSAGLRTFQKARNCARLAALCNRGQWNQATASFRVWILIGHSFAGLIATPFRNNLSESLRMQQVVAHQLISAWPTVIMILSPALEALLHTWREWQPRRSEYDRYTQPLLVVITSTADIATGRFFKYARSCNLVCERKLSCGDRKIISARS